MVHIYHTYHMQRLIIDIGVCIPEKRDERGAIVDDTDDDSECELDWVPKTDFMSTEYNDSDFVKDGTAYNTIRSSYILPHEYEECLDNINLNKGFLRRRTFELHDADLAKKNIIEILRGQYVVSNAHIGSDRYCVFYRNGKPSLDHLITLCQQEAERQNNSVEPVSYTHLTLPTM
jgi:hypothetical protein